MTSRLLGFASALALAAGGAFAQEMSFKRIASFATPENMGEGQDRDAETSAEIIAATADGETLVYTDSPSGVLGFVDIADAAAPQPGGSVALEGEPTAVAVAGGTAFVGVNTSESFTEPSGFVAAFDIESREETGRCDLGGQPDSVASAPDGSFLAIAIENERDEDAGDGRVGQMPAGYLVTVPVSDGGLDCDGLARIDLTGLAEVTPEDPEPEFVDINGEGEIVVTLQENNHVAVVRDGEVISHFSAGSVTLEGMDAEEEGAITFDATQEDVVREPDSAAWIDDTRFVTANEGDMDGGSRGWTVWNQDGEVVWESGLAFERALIEIGHYPEERSGNKGVEPESAAAATFGGTPMVFIGSERGSVVGVYDVTDPAAPELVQLLPSGIGPEGFATIPERNLLVTANEVDLIEDGGVRAHVMIFEYGEGAPAYPMLTSAGATDADGDPIGWGAISGMAAGDDGRVYAVSDSFYAMQPSIFVIDTSATPARITDVIRVTRAGQPAQKLDLEGIVPDGEGGFWLASEGRTDRLIPHALYHVGADGEIEAEVPLPVELQASELRYGFEGITMVDGALWMAVQREWNDDPEGHVKLVRYDPETEEWGAVRYPLEPAGEGWVGLSEITAHGDHAYIIERDNLIGGAAELKKIFRVPLSEMQAAPIGGDLPVVSKEEVRDLIPDLQQLNGYVQDKVEGLAILPDGTAWVSTDNDGVDDHSGETLFWSIGRM
jgi:hypothetical protein